MAGQGVRHEDGHEECSPSADVPEEEPEDLSEPQDEDHEEEVITRATLIIYWFSVMRMCAPSAPCEDHTIMYASIKFLDNIYVHGML